MAHSLTQWDEKFGQGNWPNGIGVSVVWAAFLEVCGEIAMRSSLKVAFVTVGLAAALSASAGPSESRDRWNPYGRCHQVVEGVGTGNGVFGRGSRRARVAARQNWEDAVQNMYGREYASLSYAREVRWDCKQRALLLAKCVVTAKPCGARLRG